MIRFLKLTPALLNAWLVYRGFPQASPRYRLRIWREDNEALAALRVELLAYFDETFEDARKRIRTGFDDDLSPFNDPATDPAANYPAQLNRVTLQGYLGETLGVLAIEHWGAIGHQDWIVPAMLFRVHDVEFQHLETINERLLAGEPFDRDAIRERRPGRTGDDALAFRIDDQGTITDILTIEGKCVRRHSNDTIREAHAKLSAAGQRSTGVRELINLLQDYDTPAAQQWQNALLQVWRNGFRNVGRHNGVAYACGQVPQLPATRIAWMSETHPDAAYTVDRNLEAMEFQFPDLNLVVDILYRGA